MYTRNQPLATRSPLFYSQAASCRFGIADSQQRHIRHSQLSGSLGYRHLHTRWRYTGPFTVNSSTGVVEVADATRRFCKVYNNTHFKQLTFAVAPISDVTEQQRREQLMQTIAERQQAPSPTHLAGEPCNPLVWWKWSLAIAAKLLDPCGAINSATDDDATRTRCWHRHRCHRRLQQLNSINRNTTPINQPQILKKMKWSPF